MSIHSVRLARASILLAALSLTALAACSDSKDPVAPVAPAPTVIDTLFTGRFAVAGGLIVPELTEVYVQARLFNETTQQDAGLLSFRQSLDTENRFTVFERHDSSFVHANRLPDTEARGFSLYYNVPRSPITRTYSIIITPDPVDDLRMTFDLDRYVVGDTALVTLRGVTRTGRVVARNELALSVSDVSLAHVSEDRVVFDREGDVIVVADGRMGAAVQRMTIAARPVPVDTTKPPVTRR